MTPRILGSSPIGNSKGADLEDEIVLDMLACGAPTGSCSNISREAE